MILKCQKCKNKFSFPDYLKTSVKWYQRGLKFGFVCYDCWMKDDYDDLTNEYAQMPSPELMKIWKKTIKS